MVTPVPGRPDEYYFFSDSRYCRVRFTLEVEMDKNYGDSIVFPLTPIVKEWTSLQWGW